MLKTAWDQHLVWLMLTFKMALKSLHENKHIYIQTNVNTKVKLQLLFVILTIYTHKRSYLIRYWFSINDILFLRVKTFKLIFYNLELPIHFKFCLQMFAGVFWRLKTLEKMLTKSLLSQCYVIKVLSNKYHILMFLTYKLVLFMR